MNFSLKKTAPYIFFMVFSFVSCHDKAALKQALIEKMVQEKIDNHVTKKKAACYKEAMKEALVMADSVMIQLALSRVDTSGKVNRPAKPPRPKIDLPVDTTPIRPLFEDTIISRDDTAVGVEKPAPIQVDTTQKE